MYRGEKKEAAEKTQMKNFIIYSNRSFGFITHSYCSHNGDNLICNRISKCACKLL